MPSENFDIVAWWEDRWRRKPNASGAKPQTYDLVKAAISGIPKELGILWDDANLLDLGCGRGEILEWLILEKGVVGRGVDIGRPAIGYLMLEKGIPAAIGDVRTYRSDRGKFDIVLSCFVAQHMMTEEDLRAFYETAVWHLGTGGWVILVDSFVSRSEVHMVSRPLSFHERLWREMGLQEVYRVGLALGQEPLGKCLVVLQKRDPEIVEEKEKGEGPDEERGEEESGKWS